MAIAATAGAIVLSGLTAAPAMATGQSSSLGSNMSIVSIYVDGSRNQVNWMEAGVLYPYGLNTICGGYARGTGTVPAGGAWSKTWGQFSGCIPVSWVSRTSVGMAFRSGANMGIRAFHDGGWNQGAPTLAIQ